MRTGTCWRDVVIVVGARLGEVICGGWHPKSRFLSTCEVFPEAASLSLSNNLDELSCNSLSFVSVSTNQLIFVTQMKVSHFVGAFTSTIWQRRRMKSQHGFKNDKKSGWWPREDWMECFQRMPRPDTLMNITSVSSGFRESYCAKWNILSKFIDNLYDQWNS